MRRLAAACEIRPSKQRGQNFVIDANTVRRIVRTSSIDSSDVVLEIGPGLGSLTLGLLEVARRVVAVEIDKTLADALPATVAEFAPGKCENFEVVLADALQIFDIPGPAPTALVANLPYNVSVPVLLNLFERFPSIETGLVMVQSEVAQRIAATPGSRIYGIPSLKTAWYAHMQLAGRVGRNVFWPAPNVDSALIGWTRHDPPQTSATREQVFGVIDAAFAQRRKTLRAALAGLAGSAVAAETFLRAAGISPQSRGESLTIEDFSAIASQLPPATR